MVGSPFSGRAVCFLEVAVRDQESWSGLQPLFSWQPLLVLPQLCALQGLKFTSALKQPEQFKV